MESFLKKEKGDVNTFRFTVRMIYIWHVNRCHISLIIKQFDAKCVRDVKTRTPHYCSLKCKSLLPFVPDWYGALSVG